jgi:hypothetical protein
MWVVRILAAVALAASLAGCVTRTSPVQPAELASPASARQRIAALLLRNAEFGSWSIIPVRFENSRIAGPIEEKGRTYFCVTTQMHGRTFGKPERPKALVRQDTRPEGTVFSASAYDDDICSGHKREDFPELDEAGTRKAS